MATTPAGVPDFGTDLPTGPPEPDNPDPDPDTTRNDRYWRVRHLQPKPSPPGVILGSPESWAMAREWDPTHP